MAKKAKSAAGKLTGRAPEPYDDRKWEIRDAMHTMLRAGEIIKDKKLLAAVKKAALEHATELQETANRAGRLAKMGLISDKQMAKLGKA